MVHYPHCVHVSGGGGGGGVAQHIVINAYAQYYKPKLENVPIHSGM